MTDRETFVRIRAQLEKAARLHQRGRRAEAIGRYRMLLAEAPQLPPLLNLLGLALVQDGKVADGVGFLSDAVRLAPDFADAWLNLAFARFEAKDREGAVAAYRRVLKLQPKHLTALLSLASLLIETDVTEAVVFVRRAVEIAPDHGLPWLRLRRLCLTLGDLAGVAEAERQIERIGLKTAEELVEGGHIELMQDNAKEAAAHFAKARALQPGLAVAALAHGEALLQLGDHAGALDAFRQAADLAPPRSSPWIGLGRVHLACGNRSEAAQALRQALAREEGEVQRYLLAVAMGDATTVTPAEYLAWHYNKRAVSYDSKLEPRGYPVPERIGALLRERVAGKFENALELGCGTGLVGEILRPLSRRMIGLDASLAMLNVARRKRRYDDLIEQEAMAYLSGTKETFDLIVAADVLIHTGDCLPFFRTVAEHLMPNGLFVATVEHASADAAESEAVTLQMTATFTHGEAHVRAAARAADLEVVHWEPIALPRESGVAPGSLAVFRKA